MLKWDDCKIYRNLKGHSAKGPLNAVARQGLEILQQSKEVTVLQPRCSLTFVTQSAWASHLIFPDLRSFLYWMTSKAPWVCIDTTLGLY